jgi:hypothetical protein
MSNNSLARKVALLPAARVALDAQFVWRWPKRAQAVHYNARADAAAEVVSQITNAGCAPPAFQADVGENSRNGKFVHV